MSYILEALRKSEQERQRKQSLDLNTLVAEPQQPRRSRLPWLLVGALVLINGAAIGYFVLHGQSTAVVPPPKPALPAPIAQAPSLVGQSAPVATIPSRPPINHAASEPPRHAAPPPPVAADPAPVRVNPGPRLAPAVVEKPRRSRSVETAFSKPRGAAEDNDHAYKINVLAYTPAPEDRFAVINMTKYVKGDRLPDGAIVEAIEQDAVVLSRNGEKLRISH